MQLSETRKGELIMFAEVLLWSVFPIITLLTYSFITPLISLAFSALFAAALFAVSITLRKKWQELAHKEALKDILWVVFFIGVLYYGFYFLGLKYTTAGNASIIALMEVFFNFLFFNVYKKEYITVEHVVGTILMFFGALIILVPEKLAINKGDLLILAAAASAPVGNYFQRSARKKVSSETIMFIRTLASFPIILLLALALHEKITFFGLKHSLWFLAVNGILVLGLSKILWIEAIHRLSVTKTSALNSAAPLFTLLFAFLILKQRPTLWQLLSLLPLALGVILLTSNRLAFKKEGAS